MAEKHTDEKLYRVVRKDGSHLNTKVNPDGTKSASQFSPGPFHHPLQLNY